MSNILNLVKLTMIFTLYCKKYPSMITTYPYVTIDFIARKVTHLGLEFGHKNQIIMTWWRWCLGQSYGHTQAKILVYELSERK